MEYPHLRRKIGCIIFFNLQLFQHFSKYIELLKNSFDKLQLIRLKRYWNCIHLHVLGHLELIQSPIEIAYTKISQ